MQTLEQQYARAVYEKVANYQNEESSRRESYGRMAQKLPVLIRTAGLAQALAFVEAKASGSNEWPYHRLLDDLADVLGEASRDALLQKSREAELAEYAYLTRQAMLALTWFKRFSQSILNVDITAGEGD